VLWGKQNLVPPFHPAPVDLFHNADGSLIGIGQIQMIGLRGESMLYIINACLGENKSLRSSTHPAQGDRLPYSLSVTDRPKTPRLT
ncbi:MAG: hypothetical protein QGH15_12335, partial [Kiritimatiellia bacterium]|nr:hypothetical protein [Kiritimatiellia bacterium]